ncbi:MAG TPA: serine hydrolase [Pyrinomonadaceae bacterium]|jgi:beta-lactamase class A|nr:serine hydrolase [Pyrinomonadaceae bacterium]
MLHCTKVRLAVIVGLLLPVFASNLPAQEKEWIRKPPAQQLNKFTAATSPALQAIVDEAARETLRRFSDKKLSENQLAITLIDLRDAERPAQASYRGEERIYTASVVKLFYLAAAHRWLEDGRLKETTELKRALRDMIVDSSNDATGYVLDVLTGTSSGIELPPAEMRKWQEKRNAVNRYFASLGYTNINVNQKTFCEDAYGRENFGRGAKGENRNKLTTNATARLLAEIATRRIVTPARSEQMLELLKRDFSGQSNDADDQAHGFTGIALKDYAGARLWSKAGWTSSVRHDAAYIELPNGARFVLVTFTEGHSNDRDIIPTVAELVLKAVTKTVTSDE